MNKKIIFPILGVILLIIGLFTVKNLLNNSKFTFNTNHTAVVKEIQKLNRLETASYTIEKIIEAGTQGNTFQEILYGDKILLIAHGQVVAGIDLSKLKEDDISIKDKDISLKLPAPEILTVSLDSEKTRVYDRKQGVLTKGDKNLEAQARQIAEKEIRKAACESGILNQASENAQKQLSAFLKALEFNKVEITIPTGNCVL